MIFKPHHTAFTVTDLEESIDWYQKILGFAVVKRHEMKEGAFVLMQREDVFIELFHFDNTKPLPQSRQELMSDLHEVGTKHLCIEVDDLGNLVDELKEKGIESMPIDTAAFGGKFTFIKDCNGILIEFYQR